MILTFHNFLAIVRYFFLLFLIFKCRVKINNNRNRHNKHENYIPPYTRSRFESHMHSNAKLIWTTTFHYNERAENTTAAPT